MEAGELREYSKDELDTALEELMGETEETSKRRMRT
jgi:hypothetical protein